MFSKTVYVFIFVCYLFLLGHAHGIISPMLGVKGIPVRSDVQRPSKTHPCGTVNPATALNSSQAAIADAQDRVNLTATNFNAGADGSRKVTAELNADGTGKNFTSATVSTNGDATPKNVGSQPLVVQLPAGTTCTGGNTKDICLMSLKTTSGFGNCVAVKQLGASKPKTKSGMVKETKGSNGTAKINQQTAKDDAVEDKPNMVTKGNSTMCNNKFVTKPAGARVVRSVLSAEECTVKRSGHFSWIWA